MNLASEEELISLGISDEILVLVAARRMATKHNLFKNALLGLTLFSKG